MDKMQADHLWCRTCVEVAQDRISHISMEFFKGVSLGKY